MPRSDTARRGAACAAGRQVRRPSDKTNDPGIAVRVARYVARPPDPPLHGAASVARWSQNYSGNPFTIRLIPSFIVGAQKFSNRPTGRSASRR